MYLTLLPLYLASLALAVPLSTRENNLDNADSVISSKTRYAIETLLRVTTVPGMTVAVTTKDKDEILSFGNATIWGDPVTDQTMWSVASNGKLLTAVTIAMLSEEGIPIANGDTYRLDTPLIDFMPDFKMVDDNATQHATTLDLLSHSSGLPTHNFAINDTITAKDWYHLLGELPPNVPFRSLFQYSNVNYAAAGYIVEYLTGRDLFEMIKEKIFVPLGLEGNTDLREAVASGLYANGFINMGINATQCAIDTEAAATVDKSGNGTETEGMSEATGGPAPASCYGRLEAFEKWDRGEKGQDYGGGGAFNLKATDLLKWTRAMTHAEIIPQEIIDIVDTPRFPSSSESQYNMGSYTTDRDGYRMVYHGGSVFQHFSIFGRIPDESIGVFVISNSVFHSASTNQAVFDLILDELLGVESEPASPGGNDSGSEGTAGANNPSYPPPPENLRPAAPTEELLKTYSNPGYGQFTLTTLDLDDPSAIEAVGLPPQFMYLDLATAAPYGEKTVSGQVLYAHYDHLLAEHLLFKHFNGPLYNLTIISTWPSLDVEEGEDKSVALPTGQAQALFEDGKLGVYQWVLGDQSLPQIVPEEGNVDAAEVVFTAN